MAPRSAEMGGFRPSQLSPAAGDRLVRMPETDLGNDAGGALHVLLPASRRARVIFGFDYTYTELNNAAAKNEVQILTLANGSSGETFKLAFNSSEKTGALAYDISAADLQTALRALTTINGANVTVTGNAGGPYTVTFIGTLAAADQPMIVASDCGGDLTVTPSESVKGNTLAEAQARLDIGIYNGSTDDPDAILDNYALPVGAVSSANYIDGPDFASTLQTSPVMYRGYPVVPPGYAVKALVTKNAISGQNDGKIIGDLIYAFLDD